jgi:hypothetical protein
MLQKRRTRRTLPLRPEVVESVPSGFPHLSHLKMKRAVREFLSPGSMKFA